MAENKTCFTGTQETGNPVFDATVNVAMGAGVFRSETISDIHELLLELYKQEPKPKSGSLRSPEEMADVAASE